MTPQQVFDKVVDHLRQQGKTAYDLDRKMCMYRTEDGLKCAAGCLIEDTEYSPKMEGKIFSQLMCSGLDCYCPSLDVRVGGCKSLIATLQNVHDGINPADWERNFATVARENSLIYTPPAGKETV